LRLLAQLKQLMIAPSAASLSVALIVASGAFVVKVAGLGKELAVAYKLGAGPELDAFLYAYAFPAFLIAVVIGGTAASFIPRYLAAEAQVSVLEARRLSGELATIIVFVTSLLVLLAVPVFSGLIPVLAAGFDEETRSLALRLIPLLSPLLISSVFTSIWSNLLNAHGKFTIAAFVPIVTPTVVLCALNGQVSSSSAVSLAIGTVAGGLIEVCILAICTRVAGLELFHLPRRWRPEFTQVVRQFLPAAGASMLMSATMLIDQSFAANLPPGSVSALSYGAKLAGVAASILVVVVSTLALPAFSRLAAKQDFLQLRRSFFTACAFTLVVTIPIASTLSFAAEPLLRMLFLRGSFTADDATLSASVQELHAWHLVPYILSIIAVRALAAIAESWLLLVGSLVNLVVDLLVNILMVPIVGVVAVGFASTAMYLASALVLCVGFLLRVGRRIRANQDPAYADCR
jgi:putative peptidoglycan lipid II flippase